MPNLGVAQTHAHSHELEHGVGSHVVGQNRGAVAVAGPFVSGKKTYGRVGSGWGPSSAVLSEAANEP